MIKVYSDNRTCIRPIDGYFNRDVSLRGINEKCKEYMLKIDGARVLDENTQSVITPYGACSKEFMSSSLKAIISIYNMLDKKVETPICIDDCHPDVNSILFDIVEEREDFKVAFAVHWGNVSEEDTHTFLLNDDVVCNGGAELLKHFKKVNMQSNSVCMEKLLIDNVCVSNCQKSVKFDIELKGKYIMIGGKVSTGKSLMWRLLQQTSMCSEAYESLGMDVAYHWDKMRFYNHKSVNVAQLLRHVTNTFVVIDNFDFLVNKHEMLAGIIMKDTTNQYVLLGRNYEAIGLDKKYTGELVNDNEIIRLAYNS